MPDPTSTDRAAKLAALKKQQKSRPGWLIPVVIAVVLIVVIGGVATYLGTRSSGSSGTTSTGASGVPKYGRQVLPSAVTGQTTTQPKPAQVKDDSGISGVLAWNTAGYPASGTPNSGTVGHDHVPGPVAYAVTPPIGGPHNATWMNAGIYTKPVPNERAVHNLEHGAIWITYDPKLPTSEVNQLVAFVTKQSLIAEPALEQQGISGQKNRYIDLTPWASNSLPSPIVLSSWGHQLRVSSPTDPRMQKFVDTFRNSQKYTPEYGSPVDGVPTGTGGIAALDGGTVPNPGGTAN
ncbi:DUF3105 domain-containing protein [Allobranchiibius sp. GilTou73]|uniref:DUF3105 domain-containing protein n=1 Tax=Allobranchiibius sp. GilTou73 TaxID=2904523 RepID=UPI001F28BDE0|nr:DUF3105 domain-containing protein [Allobranchiibius sp. GilTou73]UIJ35185.1 DUF3105 domain-containing protein [Allobranchiibius sp. GilTou73]